jgi:hypothetical protein
MKKLSQNLFLSLILFFPLKNIQAKSQLSAISWELFTDKDRIEIFTPTEYTHETGIVPIKFKTIINQNISKVVSVLADDQRKVQWLPKLKSSKLIETLSETKAITYYVYKSPWPFNDRDFLIKSSGVFNTKTKELYVEMISIKDHKDLKENTDNVRGFSHDGYVRVKFLTSTSTEIEMAFLNEFGGYIPSFVINLVQKKWPYIFMKNLSEQLKKDDIKIDPKFLLD